MRRLAPAAITLLPECVIASGAGVCGRDFRLEVGFGRIVLPVGEIEARIDSRSHALCNLSHFVPGPGFCGTAREPEA
ncbi:MAG: hypothetical protein WBW08_05280 [Methyloceanibacter sp.]